MFYVCHYDEVLLVWYHNLAVSDPFLLAALPLKTLCADHASSESWMPEVCFIWAVINRTCRFTWGLQHQFSKHQVLGYFLFDFSNCFCAEKLTKVIRICCPNCMVFSCFPNFPQNYLCLQTYPDFTLNLLPYSCPQR